MLVYTAALVSDALGDTENSSGVPNHTRLCHLELLFDEQHEFR